MIGKFHQLLDFILTKQPFKGGYKSPGLETQQSEQNSTSKNVTVESGAQVGVFSENCI